MATIGIFTKQENGGYDGTLETLTFKTRLTFELATKRSENAPDYRIVSGSSEVGAAWDRTGNTGRYISAVIDDPSFPAPLNCRLVKTSVEHGFSLIWDRPKKVKSS